MTLWEHWVSDFRQLVRKSVYPPDAESRIEAGREAFLRLDTDGRNRIALTARVALRLFSSFPLAGDAMRTLAGDTFQNSANLFALDDLLRRYPVMLERLRPPPVSSPAEISERLSLAMLHFLQYHAEMEQDVLVGIRDPA